MATVSGDGLVVRLDASVTIYLPSEKVHAMPSAPNPLPAVLYKYVGHEQHHLDILRQLQIRFTQPDDLNDPFDCIPGISPPVDIAAFADKTMTRNQSVITSSGYTPESVASARATMIAEYTKHPQALLDRCAAIVSKHMNSIGVLSLAQRNDNMPLWAHYAANHTGFCIGMRSDGDPLNRRAGDLRSEGELRSVSYQAARVVVSLDPLVLAPESLFIKALHWSYEEEWRIVRRLATHDHASTDPKGVPRFHLWTLAPNTIVRVDIGMNASTLTADALLAATAPGTPLQHVDVYRARLGAGWVDLSFELTRKGS